MTLKKDKIRTNFIRIRVGLTMKALLFLVVQVLCLRVGLGEVYQSACFCFLNFFSYSISSLFLIRFPLFLFCFIEIEKIKNKKKFPPLKDEAQKSLICAICVWKLN